MKNQNFKKALLACVLALIATFSTGALVQAEAVSQQEFNYTTYFVVNCKQSITLRPGADVNSGEICQIPLGSAVC